MTQANKVDSEKRKTAAALGYDSESNSAPRLLAKGEGELADRIIALAKENNIPIREDRDLVANGPGDHVDDQPEDGAGDLPQDEAESAARRGRAAYRRI